MRAVLETDHGGPEVLKAQEVPVPRPGPGQVRIRVCAAGVNRADALQRGGHYPPPPGAPEIYGLEVSGVVEALGPEPEAHDAAAAAPAAGAGLAVGQEVVALLAGGGYAECVCVDVRQVLPAPAGIGLVEAAALPEVAATVWLNLFQIAGLRSEGPEDPGVEAVLVHGGTGGVGVFAVQLLNALGYRVFATVGSAEKVRWLQDVVDRQGDRLARAGRRAGGVLVIDYRSEDFAEVVRERTEGRGVRAVLDSVGGRYLEQHVLCLAVGGHLVTIGVQGGPKGELNLARLMSRRASITGSILRGLDAEAKQEVLRSMGQTVWPLVSAGLIDPMVDRVFPLEQVEQAHEYFDSGEHRGKVLLRTS